ncbi:MAG: hypothetical protein HW385_1549 [candidate division NC10 bacterium]|nr:hypothetical protein [candidate division NC10 bacterium]
MIKRMQPKPRSPSAVSQFEARVSLRDGLERVVEWF